MREHGAEKSTWSLFHSRPVQAFVAVSLLLWAVSILSELLGWQALLRSRILSVYGVPDADSDFLLYADRFQHFHTAAFFSPAMRWPFTYPASCAVIYYLFFTLGRGSGTVFFAFIAASVVAIAVLFTHPLVKRGQCLLCATLFVLLIVVLSFPLSFEWQRANIEVVNWVLVCGAVTACWNRYWKTAALLLGVAISLKIFPFVLLGLLVAQKRYRETVMAVVVAVIAQVSSTWFVGPTYRFAREHLAEGTAFFQSRYVLGKSNVGLDHSLFALIKAFSPDSGIPPVHINPWLLAWYLGAVGLGGILLYLVRIRYMPRPNQAVVLTTVSVLMTPVSYDYTLIHMYVALAVVLLHLLDVRAASQKVWPSMMFGLFAVILSPLEFAHVGYHQLQGPIKCVALCGVLYLGLSCPMVEDEGAGSASYA